MVETNARILAPGKDIAMPVRYAKVQVTTNTPEVREKVCYRLRQEYGLIAVPCQSKQKQILVATDQPLPERQMIVDEWELVLTDTGEVALLTLDTADGWQLLPKLVERMMTDLIERRGDWWTFDSMRHWFEKQPFDAQDGIDALRRYVVSTIPVEGVGIAVAIDVETAFFTQDTVADYFETRIPIARQRERRAFFEQISQRQIGQQGTLLYNNGETSLKCFLASVPDGKTCGATAPRRVRGKSYASMVEYYRKVSPGLRICGDDLVAFVSFPGLDHPQPVAARLLKAHVMNAMLPPSLINADKIAPKERREMIIAFWKQLGKISFPQIRSMTTRMAGKTDSVERQISAIHQANSRVEDLVVSTEDTGRNTAASDDNPYIPTAVPSVAFLPRFWRPDAAQVRRIAFPTLYFGKKEVLNPPSRISGEDYRQHFRQRAEMLEKGKCYHFPPLMGRVLVCAYPDDRGVCEAAEEMMDGICQRMKQFTDKTFEFRLVPYNSIEDALIKVNQESSAQVVVFVLNDEVAAYTEAALGLPDWKIKRVTENTLRRQYHHLTAGVIPTRGRKSWESFLRMTTLDLLQEMDGVPFRLDKAGEFEAQLVIDVSYDRRYYAQSLLIAREHEKRPDFRLVTESWHKSDPKHEAINGRILYDDIIRFFGKAFASGKGVPLASLLIARDGKVVGDEYHYINQAVAELKARGLLTSEARVTVVELHKNTEMHLRTWEVVSRGAEAETLIANVTEATAIRLSASTEVLVTTGSGTLRQGTAEPLLVVTLDEGTPVSDATDALAASAQLNWSSPSVAQRLPLPFKRTDEVLKKRSEQEIRRLR